MDIKIERCELFFPSTNAKTPTGFALMSHCVHQKVGYLLHFLLSSIMWSATPSPWLAPSDTKDDEQRLSSCLNCMNREVLSFSSSSAGVTLAWHLW